MAAARGRVGFWPEKAAAPPPASQADTSGIPKERDREGFGTAWRPINVKPTATHGQ